MTEGNSINTCIHAFFFLLKHCEPQSNNAKLSLPNNTNRYCRVRYYSFVGQPLSKLLYMFSRSLALSNAKHVICYSVRRGCPGYYKQNKLKYILFCSVIWYVLVEISLTLLLSSRPFPETDELHTTRSSERMMKSLKRSAFS